MRKNRVLKLTNSIISQIFTFKRGHWTSFPSPAPPSPTFNSLALPPPSLPLPPVELCFPPLQLVFCDDIIRSLRSSGITWRCGWNKTYLSFWGKKEPDPGLSAGFPVPQERPH